MMILLTSGLHSYREVAVRISDCPHRVRDINRHETGREDHRLCELTRKTLVNPVKSSHVSYWFFVAQAIAERHRYILLRIILRNERKQSLSTGLQCWTQLKRAIRENK